MIRDIDRWVEELTDKDRQDVLRLIINKGVVVDSSREKGNGTEIFYSDLPVGVVVGIHALMSEKMARKGV